MNSTSNKDKAIRSLEDAYLEMVLGVSPDKGKPVQKEHAPSQLAGKTVTEEPAVRGLAVLTSPDGMTAALRFSGEGPVRTSPEDIHKALERKGIVAGIDREAVMLAAQRLQAPGGWRGDLPVARGTPPAHGPEPYFPFLHRRVNPGDGTVAWVAEEETLNFLSVGSILSRSAPCLIRQTPCRAKVVVPGECIATFDGPLSCKEGVDVFGRAIPAALSVLAGEHVRLNPQDNSLRSMIYGYLHIEGNAISVLSPIWVSPDGMIAAFVKIPQIGEERSPSASQLESLLRLKGVADVFIQPEILTRVAERLKSQDGSPQLIKIAAGFPAHPGRNATFTFFFKTEPKAGTVKEGDVFDLRERGLITSVKKDTLLAEKVLATKGTAGSTLFGESIHARDGVDVFVSFNERVSEEKQEGKILYRAKGDGVVSCQNDHLTVQDLFEVEGDVDYSTGNIEITSSVVVKGSVSAGFSLKSGGDVHIRGTVEMDCTVMAQGNLRVEGGILGEKTRIIVLGDLKTSFVQDAEIMVKGDILVQSYIYDASIRCGGTVTVLKGLDGLGGKIIGGIVCATRGIHASTIGSEACQSTVLVLQNKPEDLLELRTIEAEVRQCSENLLKLTRTLNIDSLAPQRMKALLAAAPPGKREGILKIFHMINQMVKFRDTLALREKEFRAKMERDLSEGVIRATETFFQGNTVQFGERKLIVPSDLSPAAFQIRDGVIMH